VARTVDAVFAAPDPTAMLPALPIRSAEPRAIARGINKLNADGGDPPIRMGWTDRQFAHSGVLTEYQRYPIPEWSSRHTAAGLLCRVRTNVFGGANGKVRFESANSGAFVDVSCGPGAGWYDAASGLACSFVGGQDEIIVSVSTTAGTLTVQAISCVWPELPDPLDAGDNDGCLAFDDAETEPDRPLSARLGRAFITSLDALEERVRVYACFAGLLNVVYGGVDCSYMPPTWHWLWCLVLPGTRRNDWRLAWQQTMNAAGSLLLMHGAEAAAGQGRDAGQNRTNLDAPSGDFRLIESAFLDLLSPLETADLAFLPGGDPDAGADPQVSSLVIWGR